MRQGNHTLRRPPNNVDSTFSGAIHAVRAAQKCTAARDIISASERLWHAMIPKQFTQIKSNQESVCLVQVYNNSQAHPEYVLWLTPQ